VKIAIIVLANDTEAMENLNAFADTRFLDLYENNKRALSSSEGGAKRRL